MAAGPSPTSSLIITPSSAPCVQMAAQEDTLKQQSEQEQQLAASISQVVGTAEPAVSEAQLGLQRVSPASFSQLVCGHT